jgi:group I intron endonuclease
MKNKICGIYCIGNTINNKKYIGASRDVFHRLATHKSILRNQRHNRILQIDFDEYGFENFVFYLLEECSIDELAKREVYYIKLYNTLHSDFGYNIFKGGERDLQYIHSKETREKISTSNTGKKRKPLDESAKEVMSIGCQGKIMDVEKTSRYVGVSFCSSNKNSIWVSVIYHKNKKIHLGAFKTEEEAALAYNNKAIELYGDKAKLNIIDNEGDLNK